MDVIIQKTGAVSAIYIFITLNEYIYNNFTIKAILTYISTHKTPSVDRPNGVRLTTLRLPAGRPSFVDPRILSDRPRGGAIAPFGGCPVSPISKAGEVDAPRSINSWILGDGIANGSEDSAPIDCGLPLLAKSVGRFMALAAKLDVFIPRPHDLSCPSLQDCRS